MSVIELRHVSRRFGSQMILRDLSLEVRAGETLVIVGESGCGKSVTMKLMMDLLRPTGGEVLWDGLPLHERSSDEIARHRLRFGYLFQGAALFDSLTVFDNVAFGLRENYRLQPAEMQEIVLQQLEEVGLDHNVASKRPAELSGGMKKRVGLARALALSPEIMFYDEPTTGLDPVMCDVIGELMVQTQQRRNVTSVVVTHDMSIVRKVADRVLMLYPLTQLAPDDPQLVFEGTAGEAFTSEEPRVKRFFRADQAHHNRDEPPPAPVAGRDRYAGAGIFAQ